MVVPHLFYHDDGGGDPSSAPSRSAHYEGPPPNMRQPPVGGGVGGMPHTPPHGPLPPMFRGPHQGMSMNPQNLMFPGQGGQGAVGGMFAPGYGYPPNPAVGSLLPSGAYLGPGSAAAADSRESILAAAMATNPQGYSFGGEMQDLYEQQQMVRQQHMGGPLHPGGPMGMMSGMNPAAAGGGHMAGGAGGGMPPPPGFAGQGGWSGAGGYDGMGGAGGQMFEAHPGMPPSMMYNPMGQQQSPHSMAMGSIMSMQMPGQGPGQPAQYGSVFSPQQQQHHHQQQQMMLQAQQYGYGDMTIPHQPQLQHQQQQQQAQLPPMNRQKRRTSSISSNEDDSSEQDQQQHATGGGPLSQQSPLPQIPASQHHQQGLGAGNPNLMTMQHYASPYHHHAQQMQQQMQPMGGLAGQQQAMMYGSGGGGGGGGMMMQGSPYATNTAPMTPGSSGGGVAGGGPDVSTTLGKNFSKRKEKKRRTKTFPEKLLSNIIDHSDEDCVAWLPDGKSFVIVNADSFVEQILRPNFKECKYASFVRKLHRWGFVRLTSGTGTDCFHHPYFQKGRKDLVAKINCMPREKDGTLKGAGKPPSLAGVERFIQAKAAAAAAGGNRANMHKATLRLKQIVDGISGLVAEPPEGGLEDVEENERPHHHNGENDDDGDDSSLASEQEQQQQGADNSPSLQAAGEVYS